MQPRRAPLVRQCHEPLVPARFSLRLLLAQEPEPDQAVVQLVGVCGSGPVMLNDKIQNPFYFSNNHFTPFNVSLTNFSLSSSSG